MPCLFALYIHKFNLLCKRRILYKKKMINALVYPQHSSPLTANHSILACMLISSIVIEKSTENYVSVNLFNDMTIDTRKENYTKNLEI